MKKMVNNAPKLQLVKNENLVINEDVIDRVKRNK